MKQRKCIFFLILIFLLIIFSFLPSAYAKIIGTCVNCHTMHNSQGGEDMATFGATGKPWKTDTVQPALLRGTCLGCHGLGVGNKIETINGNEIPQVYHTDSSDLAGGNFRYIDDNDNRGHNVYMDLGNMEDTLLNPPGHHISPEAGYASLVERFTCAGASGCHGKRIPNGDTGVAAIKGAHHQNTDGLCDIADTVANSYRFLYKVKGFENMGTYKYENFDSNNHNEYFGAPSPTLTDADTDCTTCHDSDDDMIIVIGNTISAFCASCHERFYAINSIGGTSSPFVRHPSDIALPSDGEYAFYETYSVEAPVGRTTMPVSMSSTVSDDDVVTCLSCHAAHATNYPDLLRWNYDEIIAGGGESNTGCFNCHTQKDN